MSGYKIITEAPGRVATYLYNDPVKALRKVRALLRKTETFTLVDRSGNPLSTAELEARAQAKA